MVAGEVPVRRAASDAPCSSSSMTAITTVSGEPSSSTTCSSRCTRTPAATVSEWEERPRAAERWQHLSHGGANPKPRGDWDDC
jgi:hypothetical protein